jgi:Bifunctional DNA primase/polymerase, N-terminal
MANPVRTMRMVLAFEAGAHSDRSKMEGHDFNQLQVAQLCGSHLLAVVPSHGLKAGQCTCGRGKKCKRRGRHPRTIQDPTTDGEAIHQFWTRWPKAKVIVATGQQGIIAVTASGRKGDQALATLADNDAVETLEFREGRLHTFLLSVPEDAIPNGRVRLADGVVVHGRGSFIVVPRNVTRPGRYKQLFDNEIALAPSWLLRLLGAPAPSETTETEKDGADERKNTDMTPSKTMTIANKAAPGKQSFSERTFDERLNFDLKNLALEWIIIPDGSPPCNDDKVRALAESYRVTDVRAPLAVRLLTLRTEQAWPTFSLLSDPHQLEALKRLDITCADCLVIEGDETDERLFKLAELIHQPKIKRLDWALSVMAWASLLRAKGWQSAKPRGGIQPHDKGLSAAARILGVSRRDAGRAAQIASISAEAQQEIRRAGLDDIDRALLEIADEPPEQQVAKALELRERYRKPRQKREPEAGRKPDTGAGKRQVPENEAPSPEEPAEEDYDQPEERPVESPATAPTETPGDVEPSAVQRGAGNYGILKARWDEYVADDWDQYLEDEWRRAPERDKLRFIKEVFGCSVRMAGKNHSHH